MADKIRFLCNNKGFREMVCRNNVRDVERFDWRVIVEEYIDLYSKIVG